MNYSRKKTTKNFGGIAVTALKAVTVAAAAFCLSGGFYISADDAEQSHDGEICAEEVCAENSAELLTAEFDEVDDSDEGFVNPAVGVLTSGFGQRWGRAHSGIDIGADNGEAIYAAADGTVIFSGTLGGYGNYIRIDHGGGVETAYGHCSSLSVGEGETVSRGQLIAYVGSTGNSTGPHLHFEVKVNGEFRDPLDYVTY